MAAITLCGEIFSDNLGDGVIGDCLSMLVRKHTDRTVTSIDLSMQEKFGPGLGGVLTVAPSTPSIRRSLARNCPTMLKHPIKQAWWRYTHERTMFEFGRRHCEGTELLIIGGGQLLQDNGLQFPLKIRALVRGARAAGVGKIAYFACGVRGEWSPTARRIMREALEGPDVLRIVTRDAESADNIASGFPGLSTPVDVAGDTAVWAREAYPEVANRETLEKGSRPLVGLGVISSMNSKAKRGDGGRREHDRMIAFCRDLVTALDAEGFECRIFTNGATTDETVAAALHGDLGERTKRLDRPLSPQELVANIAQFDAIVAWRLHAHIVAYALGIPSAGLIWDLKTVQFGRLTGRERFFIGDEERSASLVATRLREAIENGVDANRQASLKQVVSDSLAALLRDAGVAR